MKNILTLRNTSIVKVVTATGEEISFRLEVFERQNDAFECSVFRLQSLRVQPSFPQIDGEPDRSLLSDYDINVLDDMMAAQPFIGSSVEEVLCCVVAALEEVFQAGK